MKKTLGTMVAIMVVAILIGTFITAKYAVAGEKARDGRFIAYDNGTVLDTKTNLMWAAKDNGKEINWAKAKSYCENYRGGGYKDWRMPTLGELAGLYNPAKTYKCKSEDCGADVHLTELIQLTCYFICASKISGFDNAYPLFHFGLGKHQTLDDSSFTGTSLRALPVRSGK